MPDPIGPQVQFCEPPDKTVVLSGVAIMCGGFYYPPGATLTASFTIYKTDGTTEGGNPTVHYDGTTCFWSYNVRALVVGESVDLKIKVKVGTDMNSAMSSVKCLAAVGVKRDKS